MASSIFHFDSFNLFSLLVRIVFALILSVILVMIVRHLIEWKRNNDSPVETAGAKLVAKRSSMTLNTHINGDMPMTNSSTTYYATFELDGGERREFRLRGRDYGLLVEGDEGLLRWQGTRWLSFDRRGANPQDPQ
ncbi:MAG: DUF2500 domain-containing protein [Oscillospiraceae bacterium]|nr:DUF2500 domain-containing protein [Oscillospiraceae bacterium]